MSAPIAEVTVEGAVAEAVAIPMEVSQEAQASHAQGCPGGVEGSQAAQAAPGGAEAFEDAQASQARLATPSAVDAPQAGQAEDKMADVAQAAQATDGAADASQATLVAPGIVEASQAAQVAPGVSDGSQTGEAAPAVVDAAPTPMEVSPPAQPLASLAALTVEQPKVPMTAYFLYVDEQRPIIAKEFGDEAKATDVVKTIAARWRDLSDEGKAPYEKKAAATRAEYYTALENFRKAGGVVVTRKRKADADAKLKKDKDAPKKPAGGGYGQFLAENRAELMKSLPAGSNAIADLAKAAGAQWKILSEEEKKPYEDKYKEKMQAYRVAMVEHTAKAGPQKAMTPKKAKAAVKTDKTPTPSKPAKSAKGKVSGATPAAKAEVFIESKVLAEAAKLGYEAALRNLAGRADVKGLKKLDRDLLEAIKTSRGLVNPARYALLGA
jgi:hypothetical protein